MAKYGVTVKADTYYEIEANSMVEAEEKALSYWDEYMPDIEIKPLENDEEVIMLRANTLGGMNAYVEMLGDDSLSMMWYTVFPDGCDEDELMEIAKDEEIFTDAANMFARILRCV